MTLAMFAIGRNALNSWARVIRISLFDAFVLSAPIRTVGIVVNKFDVGGDFVVRVWV